MALAQANDQQRMSIAPIPAVDNDPWMARDTNGVAGESFQDRPTELMQLYQHKD
jgi:hypothetical protein